MSFQRRMSTWPWPVTFGFVLLVGGAAMALLGFAYDRPDWPNLWPVLGVVLVLLAAGTTVAMVVRRRRLRAQGRWEAVLEATDAFHATQLPADPAARRELVRMLASQHGTLPLLRWFGPLIFGLQAVAQLGNAIDRPRAWVAVGVFGGLAVAYPLLYRRTKARLDTLDRALAAGS